MMSRKSWIALLALAGGFFGVSQISAQVTKSTQPPQTVTEKLKSTANSAVESLKKGAANAEEAISNQFHKAKTAIASMGVEARVYSRIHWDKNLSGSNIELGSPEEGTISLTGTVATAKAKARAVELTTDTIGVVNVVDNLTVDPAAAAIEPAKK